MKLQLGSQVETEKGGGHLIARHRPATSRVPRYTIQLFDGTICSSGDSEYPQVEQVSSVTIHSIDNPSVPAGLRSFLLGDT